MEEYQKNTVKNLEQEESILVNIDIDKFLNFITQLQNKIWIIFLNTKFEEGWNCYIMNIIRYKSLL